MQNLEHQLSVVLKFLVPTKTRYKKGPSLIPCQPFPSAGGEDQRWKSSWENDKNYSYHRNGGNDGKCCLFKGVKKRWGEVRKSHTLYQLVAAFRCWWTVRRGSGSYMFQGHGACARVGSLDTRNKGDSCSTSMDRWMRIFSELTFSNSCYPPLCLPSPVSQFCSPKFTDQRGAVESSQDVVICDDQAWHNFYI